MTRIWTETKVVRVLVREMLTNESGKLIGKGGKTKHITVRGREFDEILQAVLKACEKA